jgi:predicted PurR-regulated permease PerM
VRARQETAFWLGVLGSLGLLLWLLSSVLLPFVVGMAIGYFLDPVVERLTGWGLSRAAAAGLLISASFTVGALALLLVLPPLIEQTLAVAQRLPDLMTAVHEWLRPFLTRTLAGMGTTSGGELAQAWNAFVQRTVSSTAGLFAEVVSQGLALLNVVSLLAVTPLVAFYLLRDWPRIIAEIESWLPQAHAAAIREQARAIDTVLAGFARGAAIVCGVLSVFYAAALSVVGLDFGLVIGFSAGALSFVPYLGFIIGLVSSVGVALYQFWPHWVRVIVVLGIFLAGQVLGDYILTPRLVGERTGLHPLWVIFGVFAGGALFGFVGMLLSVPACAAIGVLARFALARYKESALYLGPGKP